MSFGLSAAEYLVLVEEFYAEHVADPQSVRKAMALCVFINHLPEQLFADESLAERDVVHGCTDIKDYRRSLAERSETLSLIRDLCDYTKHGPKLTRSDVDVDSVNLARQPRFTNRLHGSSFVGNSFAPQRFLITLKDGGTRWLGVELQKAMDFWRSEFVASGICPST